MVLVPANDHRIVDKHFIEFEAYDSSTWIKHIAYARSIEYDRDDAHMLSFINAQGQLRFYNPVRNVRIQPGGKK